MLWDRSCACGSGDFALLSAKELFSDLKTAVTLPRNSYSCNVRRVIVRCAIAEKVRLSSHVELICKNGELRFAFQQMNTVV